MENFDNIVTIITSRPSKNFYAGENSNIGIPDYDRAIYQHEELCCKIRKAGAGVIKLESDEDFPSKCFINNMAVVTEYVAILSNFPKDSIRQGEQEKLASALAGERILNFISFPGYFDADDVLRLKNNFYIRLSDNTNEEGAAQLAFFLKESGFNVEILENIEELSYPIRKAAVYLGNNRILVREDLAKHFAFLEYDKIIVSYEERNAVDSIMVNGTLVMPVGYSDIVEQVRDLGITVVDVNISEFEKLGRGINSMLLSLAKVKRDSTGIRIPKKISGVAA